MTHHFLSVGETGRLEAGESYPRAWVTVAGRRGKVGLRTAQRAAELQTLSVPSAGRDRADFAQGVKHCETRVPPQVPAWEGLLTFCCALFSIILLF